MARSSQPLVVIAPGQPPLRLVGHLHGPVAPAASPVPGVVLCHPQPIVADMEDPLIITLAEALAEAGFAALRFNFRGVALSEGRPTDGRLEPLDVAGAVQTLTQQPGIDGRRLAVLGHAFGAIPALSYAAADPHIGAVVAISPPHFRLTDDLISAQPQARLFVSAAEDEVSPRHKIEPWLRRWPLPPELVVVPQAQHLLRGQEGAAAAIVRAFLLRWAHAPGKR